MQVESSASPPLTIDEVEKVQRQGIASFIGHAFQLTHAALVDKLIQQEKLNHCHGCTIQYPSQNQHSCLMMDNDNAWMYYHDEVVEQIDLNSMLNATETIPTVSRKVAGKIVDATIPKGNMGYDQYTVPDTVAGKTSFVAFL